ncbi:MAG: THUMP domain-containing protein [Nitrososphaerota archaeon]|jgi:tRNA acetyltransferase TAN1|nr:THUMP domain-containing protein [Nitrososphaerota archaeon]
MLKDFNILASTVRGNERAMVNEILFLLKDHLGDLEAAAVKTGVRGIIVARTSLDPYVAVEKLHNLLGERPYEFRFALRIIPIERVVPTSLEAIKQVALEFASRIGENETYRITIEKRYTTLHSMDIISAVAAEIQNKADMENPNKIVLIEIMGAVTGVSLIKPNEIISVMKEKMI